MTWVIIVLLFVVAGLLCALRGQAIRLEDATLDLLHAQYLLQEAREAAEKSYLRNIQLETKLAELT